MKKYPFLAVSPLLFNLFTMVLFFSFCFPYSSFFFTGNSIAVTIEEPVDRYVLPRLEGLMPEDYKKWAKPVVSYTIKSLAISIAWTVQRVISAFHSAIRGGLMFSRNILLYASEMKYMDINHEDTYIDEIVGGAIAVLGFLWQMRNGFNLPFPLNVLLFPFTVLERVLIWVVCSK